MNETDQARPSAAERGSAIWRDMMRRTSQVNRKKSCAYAEVSVCDEWKDLEKFSNWYMDYQGKKEGFQLDKDLLGKGACIYSPDTCCFLPATINAMLISRRSDSNDKPGVYMRHGRFLARIRNKGLRLHVGSFSSAQEAYAAYLAKKRELLQLEAKKFKCDLPADVYRALMNYEYDKPGHSAKGGDA